MSDMQHEPLGETGGHGLPGNPDWQRLGDADGSDAVGGPTEGPDMDLTDTTGPDPDLDPDADEVPPENPSGG